MQQDKSEVIFDPNQVFPVPFTLISNLKKSLTSTPLKQPFGYEVYCPISCKKIKIGVMSDKNTVQAMQFNTTSSRWISANIQNDIKYLVNGHNPTKKDKKKAAGEMLSVYIDVQDRGNIAIFNPFYIDPEKPLSFYTFSNISKAQKPGSDFKFGERFIQKGQSKSIVLNNRRLYLFEQRGCSFICTNENFDDISDNYVTILHPENKELIYRDSARDIKQLVNEQLHYWLNQFQEHYILQQTGKSKVLQHNIDTIYKKLSFYLNIDEQLRIKLSTNKNKDLLKELYPYHPRMYNAMNRLCSFINYGNTKHDVKKLADLGFFNKTDMLQDLVYVECSHVSVPTAEEGLRESEEQLRQRTFPYARMSRALPFPNVDLESCLIALPAQTVSKAKIILTQTTNPYIIFVDKNKKLTAWSGKLAPFKLFQLDLVKEHTTNLNQHKILTTENIEKQIPLSDMPKQKQTIDLLIGDMFNEPQSKPEQSQNKPPQEPIPDQLMVEQLLSMGYKLSIIKQALINVKNESIPVALDEIQKLMIQQKKVDKKKPKPKTEWSCPSCTFLNPATVSVCEMCSTEPEFVDQEQIEKKKKQQEQKKKEQQEFKKQLQRKKQQQEKKLLQEEEKKKQEQQEKKRKEEFLRRAEIRYCKLFRSKESSINPFVVVTLLADKELGRSLMKVTRIGYNRLMMTQFYRYEKNSFVSNFTRNIYEQNQQSIQPINEVIKQSWEQIQQVSRMIHGYREDEFIVLEEKELQWNVVVDNVTCDGNIVAVGLKDEEQQMYKFTFKDTLEKSTFQLIKAQEGLNMKDLQQNEQKPIESEDKLTKCTNKKKIITKSQLKELTNNNVLSTQLSNNTASVFIEVIEHLPAGSYQQLAWSPNLVSVNNEGSELKTSSDNNNNEIKPQSEIVMSEFLPIMIETYEGSIFSSKYHSTSLFERNNLYISNYPEANFTFKNIQNKPLLVETVTVISHNKRLQKIYPIETGLVFTANELCWFQISKKVFANFTKKNYEQWLENKKSCSKQQQGHREFWEPVAFVELNSQTQVEIEYKRSAKYVFFLPTSVKTYSDKVDVAALKIDFFGVKGRVEEMEEEVSRIENFKNDVKTNENKLIVSTVLSQQVQPTESSQTNNVVIKHRSCINTINFLPKSYNGFDDIDLSITTVYEIRLKNPSLQHEIKINSPFLYQLMIEEQNTLQKQDQGESKVIQIESYKKLIQNYNILSQGQVMERLQNLQMREFVEMILSNTKSFRIFEKLLKMIYDNEQIKQQLFESMSSILPEMCNNEEVVVTESGLKSFLRIYEKLVSTLPLKKNSRILEKSLNESWLTITSYVSKIRNKNYTVIRNKYNIQELILQPELFSKDYYRLIHPNYIEEEVVDSIVQEPKTEINNLYFVQKQNNWFYKTHIVLPKEQLITKVNLHFPKLLQPTNRYKLCIKIFVINDNEQKQVFYRYWNEEMLYQFGTIAYKDKEIYAGERVNYFGVDVNLVGRVIRFEYSYLLVTTINALRYKDHTESLIIYPIVKGNLINDHVLDNDKKRQGQISKDRNYQKTISQLQKFFPKQAKHSSSLESLPPAKYTTDRQFTFYQIYEFPIINHERISKEFTSLIDKIGTNIMDQKIVEECIKGMKISQYKYNQKGLDFAYTLLIKVLKLFKKLPQSTQVDTELLLEMFDVFVVYQIGPIMKKVMAFISENYKRLAYEEKIEFVAAIIEKYLSSFTEYKELKESEKYSLVKIIEKLQELELPIGLLIGQLEKAYQGNNRFLVSMLLKLIRPNLMKFGLKEHNFCPNETDHKCIITLKQMLATVFKFNLWVLDSVENIKIELLTSGMELFETLNTTSQGYAQKHNSREEEQFVNEIKEEEIWKLVFLTLKLKNEQLNKQINCIFRRLVSNSTETFKKSLNRMLLEIIKKDQNSLYSKINGEVNDDLWMNHLQTILEYLDINEEKSGGNIVEDLLSKEKDGVKQKKNSFVLDVDTAIELLELPLTPTLWSHALLIIPKEDKVLNAIIKNFKKEYYSSLGKEITQFCEPLAGIRSLDSIHVNWLDLVKKIRLENRSIFSLFIEELRKSTFGGKEGVTMAATEDVKQLQITSEFLKLVLEKELPVNELDEATISEIFVWYFINSTESIAESPASESLKRISQNVLILIKKISENPVLVQPSIRSILSIKRDSQKLETMYEQNRIPTHSALTLTKRFCKCFEELIQIFMSNDQISGFFAFEINGLGYLMEKLGLMKNKEVKSISKPQSNAIASYLPEEEFLLDEKILSKRVQNNNLSVQIKSLQELKEQEFANNVKIVPTANSTTSTNNTDWTVYKKGNKTKIVFLSMVDPATYFEYPLYLELGKTVEVRSIKIGFPCASFQYTDKIVVSPSAVLIEGSTDGKNYQPLGEMTYIDDDGYLSNGVKVFALNLQKVKKISKIDEAIKGIQMHRIKYLKIVVKRPLVSFIQGQYSPLNGRLYNNVGVSISFMSVMGDDMAKIPTQLIEQCKQMSKKSALNILKSLLTESNLETMKKISNQEKFSSKVKENFHQLKQLMYKYKEIVPQIIYTLGSNNTQLGDWLIENFIRSAKEETEAKIINQIIVSTPQKIYQRINYFQKQLFKQFAIIRSQSQVESSLLYVKYVPFMESFCKTLEECYEIDFHHNKEEELVLDCDQVRVDYLIDIYDRKHSSPDIKSLLKLLISLVWIRKPLKLSQEVVFTTLDSIWRNCSEVKPYFYNIMSALLVSKVSVFWIKNNDHQKVKSLIVDIENSLQKDNLNALKSQMFLLSILSYHESQYLREIEYHIKIYNFLKLKTFNDSEIYEYLMKILQNVVLGTKKEEEKFAALLIEDVSLLVKRKDPILQKLFVGLLGVEQEVMIHLKGVDIASRNSSKNKKVESVPSKILSKQQQKSLAQKLGKKFKYHLAYQTQDKITQSGMQTIIKSLYNSSTLMILNVQRLNKTFHMGIYCPTLPTKHIEDENSWQEELLADKNTFIFTYSETDHKFITCKANDKVISVYSPNQYDDYQLIIQNNSSDLLRISIGMSGLLDVHTQMLNESGNKMLEDDARLLGFELFECKPFGTGKTTDSKLNDLLSKSNQAKVPFTWYRHNQLYIFPADITISKLEKLLSSKISIENFQEMNENIKLKEIENEDFIIDVTIENPDDYEGQEDFGYIPKMNIFDSFSRLGGINEVLRLGSQSIKDWKNAQRKKNFEHYMDQLKSFIHLPNFFSLFIKNHTYVTFLFEVASGMPDDSNSARNWQEEQVNSSRFIYKILSDIFKFDRSKQLRDMNKYEEFCEIILQKLSEIAKQAPRVYKENQIKEQQNLEVSDKLEKKKTEQQKRRKKKGTGYGADNQNNSKWSSTEWLENKKIRSQQTLRVVSIFVSFLDCEVPIQDERLSQVIKSSCLLPLIESALRSSSLLQIAKQIDLFKCYLSIIRNIAKNPSTIGCLMQIEKNYKPQQTESIHSLLGKLNSISEIFLECLKSGKQTSDESNQNTESLAVDIQKTFQQIDKAVRSLSKNKNALTIKQINDLPIQTAYRMLLEKLRFGYVDMKKGTGYDHCLHSSVSSSSPSTQKILRLSQQLADLSSSLPCEHTNSIFVRCDKNRIDLVKILIMGSKDTPYSNGAFMFDLYCDDSYPNNPPKMVIATTGQGKIRFNPNLYSCGKVCLSLLGTWRGSASENWDPKLSTLLQLFISTQGITMSEDVYFNEPGFDGEQGTEQGDKKNEAYSNIVRLGNIRYAMIEQIKNPPKGFQEVIQRHFYAKKKEIIEECEKWLQWAQKRQASYTGLVSDHNSSWCSQLKATKTKYKELLQIQIEQLKQILNKIPEPDLKQKTQEQGTFSKVEKKKRKAKQAELEIDVAYDKEKKEELKIEENVIQDRWSRYIGAMGLEAVKKQSSSNVLLVGLKPLGLQIAKNLILSGLQKLTIVENETLDSGSEQHFYMSDLKGKKIQQCIFKLKQLNPYMLVDHLEKLPEQFKDYHLIVSTLSIHQSEMIAQKCRKEGVKFVYAQTCGVSGSYFADFGEKFVINDTNGEEPFEGLIEKITCEKQGVVKLLEGVKHPYQDGDFVVLTKVEGMQLANEQPMEQLSEAQLFYNKTISTEQNQKLESINGHVFQIKVINWNSFSIGDTTKFKPYVRNGIVKNIKVPKTVKFKSFEHCVKEFDKFVDPNMGIYDFEKMGDNFAVFACFLALSRFEKKHNSKLENWNQQQCKQFIQDVKQISEEYKKSQDEIKEILKFANKFAPISQAQLPTIGAYLGGIVSQQIIKGLTNKYTPINQFFTFHLNEMMQKIPEDQNEWNELKVKKEDEFRNIKIVIGQQNMKKIEHMNLFVVGAGAIGCELLKNFAMVNMCSKGKITVTDPDHIETSNLTRQFLFRQKHVKKPKSATAAAVLMQMNPHLKNHISARLDKVCEQSEDIYSDQFFKAQTVVANALDNVKARQYMDKRCVDNKIPLFESGTLGPKGHVQVIVPYKTQNYGSQADPEEETQIPHCTLKMFPEDLTHCIEWSRDIFGKIFTLNPKALKKIIDSKDLSSIQGKQKTTVAKMIKHRPKTFEDCINEAVRVFFKYFRNDIRQLLYTYPLDMKTKEGKLFWTLPKRPPREISQIDPKNENHQTFIASYSVLFAKIFSIEYPKEFRKPEGKSKIIEHAVKVKVEDFIPSAEKSKEIQEMNEKQEKTKQKMSEGNQKNQIQSFEQYPNIDLTPEVLKLEIKPEEFEKDEDENGHIDLIYSMSNLRGQNYDLGECKWIDAKLKAGRIMAALSTTTSVVAAIQTLEIIKIVTGCEIWRNAFVNLAVPLVQISEPGPAVKEKIGNTEFSVWQDWQFKASSLRDLLTQINDKYEVEGFNISTAEGTPIFWQAMYKDKQEAQQILLTKNLSQLIGKQKTALNILFRDLKGENIYQKVPKVIVQASE